MPELLLQLLNMCAKNVDIIRRTALALLESALWLAFCCVLAHVVLQNHYILGLIFPKTMINFAVEKER